jgi:NAD(P)-dependent dehydrogenase (short-subunit alcohol dehydrogenase family)
MRDRGAQSHLDRRVAGEALVGTLENAGGDGDDQVLTDRRVQSGVPMRLNEKVAIVTGGAHGMGEAEARLFAAEGAKILVADILGSDAERVTADIRAGGREAIAAKIDVTSEPEWKGLIAKAVAAYGRLDILVNNAGISGSSVGDPDGIDGWDRIIAVHQTSVFFGTKLAAEQMAKTGGGSIVNISSAAPAAILAIMRPRGPCGSTPKPRSCGTARPASGSTPSIPVTCRRC